MGSASAALDCSNAGTLRSPCRFLSRLACSVLGTVRGIFWVVGEVAEYTWFGDP